MDVQECDGVDNRPEKVADDGKAPWTPLLQNLPCIKTQYVAFCIGTRSGVEYVSGGWHNSWRRERSGRSPPLTYTIVGKRHTRQREGVTASSRSPHNERKHCVVLGVWTVLNGWAADQKEQDRSK